MNLDHKQYLKEKGISPSYTRIKIFEYLEIEKTHPTVDEIYKELSKVLPTLSKTTVYNVLNLFIENGFVKSVNIGNNEMNYEFISKVHSHFKCDKCGMLYDIPLVETLYNEESLSGFKIKEKDVLFKGICKNCQSS